MDDVFIVAGGGIGGLATALALQRNGFLCHVYERDLDFQSRRQGYSLTIQKNGFEALERLGIAEDVRQLGVASTILGTATYNNEGKLIFSKPKRLSGRNLFSNFAVPRQSLRQCLVEQLKPDTIHWNRPIVRYESVLDDPDHVRVIFADNSSIIGRALIGCDGVRSAIRQQMLGDALNYLGVWAINGIAPHHNHPSLLNQTVQIIDGRSRLFIKPFSGDRCMWQLTFQVSKDDDLFEELVQHDLSDLLNKAKSMMKDWHEPIPQLLDDTPVTDVRAGPIFDRDPLENISKDVARVTMLGDAVHPMSPFKGQGANQALVDAVTLVQCLIKHQGEDANVEKAFADFESDMLNRSKKFMLESRFAVNFLHTQNALSSETMSLFARGKLKRK